MTTDEMAKAKHTPGPWTNPGTDGGDSVISATVDNRRRTIAHVYAPYCDKEESEEQQLANARLIAAAPELLKALEKCALILCGENLYKNALEDAIKSSLSAIKKAKGE